jgi:hypothetical protein
MDTKTKRLIVILPVIVVLVALGVVYMAMQAAFTRAPGADEQFSAAAPVEAAPVQDNGTAMAPAADTDIPPEAAAPASGEEEAGVVEGSEGAADAGSTDEGMGLPGSSAEGEEQGAAPEAETPAMPAARTACSFPQWVGKPVDEAAVKAQDRPYRILKPGAPMTMDYSPARIDLKVDDNGVVTEVTCG